MTIYLNELCINTKKIFNGMEGKVLNSQFQANAFRMRMFRVIFDWCLLIICYPGSKTDDNEQGEISSSSSADKQTSLGRQTKPQKVVLAW